MPKSNAQATGDKPASGDVTRRRLLSAAASLIVERGWGAVTTRAVAERAGANQALVHYHFGSIDNLRRESVLAELGPAIGELIDQLLDDRPVPESIHKVMGLVDRFDLGTDAGVLMAESLLQATRDPKMAQDMARVMGSWGELLGPRLAVAQERGVVRGDIPAEQLTSVLAAFLDGFLIQRMADPGLDTGQAADTLIQLLSPAGGETP
jgi:AcrR family transcriptional regulator